MFSLLYSISWDHLRAVNSLTLTDCSCLWLGDLVWHHQSKEICGVAGVWCSHCSWNYVHMELCTADWHDKARRMWPEHHSISRASMLIWQSTFPPASAQSVNTAVKTTVAMIMREGCTLRRADWKLRGNLGSWCHHRANKANITLSLLHEINNKLSQCSHFDH